VTGAESISDAIWRMTMFALVALIGLLLVVAAVWAWIIGRKRDRRGFEVMKKPTSGLTPEQREREAHHG
jgi:hypothetical protein